MKFLSSKLKSNSGSVLATTMVITFVIGATLASFLLLTQHQTFANARSQSWNQTMAVSEAGVEDALQLINKYNSDSTKLPDWILTAAADGWVHDPANNVYSATRTIGSPVQAIYRVFVTNSNPTAPAIRSEGFLIYDYEFNHNPASVASVGTTSGGFQKARLNRNVVVQTRRDALWALAMLADKQIDFKGKNIHTDSFDSADPNASDWAGGATFGTYNKSKRKDNGDVASNYDILDTINSGNATIMGHVSTGPGGTVAIGPNGSVGSKSWVEAGTTGVETGYVSDDMNVRLTPVSLPSSTWLPLPDAGKKGAIIGGKSYRHVITGSGDYTASTLGGSVYVQSNVNARVYISDSVSLTSSEEIRIDARAQRLTVYMGGSQFKLGGSGIANQTGNAGAFLYFGLPSNTAIDFGGNAAFVGAIYAPQAEFTLGGGGNDTFDFIGASVTKSVKMNGHYNFHYDENLANIGPSRGFVPTAWAER